MLGKVGFVREALEGGQRAEDADMPVEDYAYDYMISEPEARPQEPGPVATPRSKGAGAGPDLRGSLHSHQTATSHHIASHQCSPRFYITASHMHVDAVPRTGTGGSMMCGCLMFAVMCCQYQSESIDRH